jgi:hypothetical protein
MFTSPTWLPTGLKNQVQGLIDCVTLPDSGNRKTGNFPLPACAWTARKISDKGAKPDRNGLAQVFARRG